ncbi:hypothetical protein HQ305_07635 [Rhodococcus sp. BP-149]|uniref:Rv3212 family protein n=1 Tax=unclassified Rhodococcus (in: high G+C Gram-positive bacteria) TaxID=192944 RepID=UPI001C9A359B|nr:MULTISPECIES: PQQ-binding-like beta-propeller repeat protein [unclassified Rhodococcus (in: high G+C Gram-positive bacteria)]MBY6683821.1 hypothetical protein [Rhodococcus sp. BP-288]MBY6695064.1 hypothetical protein [Rhodococcus sp. BP-188]MBY6697715.1 hypothetical protein [Rhodococcus sp. BP-285]MBY6702392.1 hypothetical protein [Rhodococcus sp. BP-283]MBY6709675.1 hypothetical protein [Rhodococcus sp. BP-160]
MLAPERRTRVDVIAAVVIVVVVLVGASVIWFRSDARGTTSVVADVPLTAPASALSVPESFSEIWRADDTGTGAPTTVGGAVVVSTGDAVTGLDPATGSPSWSYTRDRALCSVVGAWDAAVAVFRDGRGCGQVTELDGSTGAREDQRTNDADDPVRLSFDGTYVTELGATRLELWRSDLVRTLEYGRVDAPVNPRSQPRTGCDLVSSASASTRLAVLERCPGEEGLRLTSMNPAPKDNTVPDVYGSTILADVPADAAAARVLAVVGDRLAVYLPPAGSEVARVALFDGSANFVSAQAVTADVTTPSADALASDIVRTGSVVSWWTGADTVGFTQSDLSQRWVLAGTLGAGAVMAGQLLVPVSGGIAVVDPENGVASRTIAVDRGEYTGPVALSVLGTSVFERRGAETVALG